MRTVVSIEILVALISGLVAVLSIVISTSGAARTVRVQHRLDVLRAELVRQESIEDVVKRYREPLLRAAFDLQSRMYNVVALGFFARHLGSDSPDQREYAQLSTMFRLAEYFGWVEILRRGIQFLDLGSHERTRELAERLALISRIFAATDLYPASAFRLFRDEQRALGELMLEPSPNDLRGYQTIGYARFVDRVTTEPGFARWFARLIAETSGMAVLRPDCDDRLVRVQHELVGLIDFLDPDGIRFPADDRRKLASER